MRNVLLKPSNFFVFLFIIIVSFKVIKSPFEGLTRIRAIQLLSEGYYGKNYQDLIFWARHTNYKLFVIPPLDQSNKFEAFRYFSRKSIWAAVQDVNQLAYSPDFYLENFKRLQDLGFTFVTKRNYFFSYDPCVLKANPRLKPYPIVFYNSNLACMDAYEELYSNPEFKVVKIK